MKRIILTIILSFSFMLSFAAPKYTAKYYIAEVEKYLDKEVTLRISDAMLITPTDFKKDGYKVFSCWTYYDEENGGLAYVLVPDKKAKSFASNYARARVSKYKGGSAQYKAVMRTQEGVRFFKYYFEGK